MRCDYYRAGVCRSCTHLDIPYPAQVAAKDGRVRDVLSRVVPAGAWRAPFVGPESGFRNKAKLVADITNSLVETLGKKPEHTHIVIDEVDEENWGYSGMLTTEYRKREARS